MLGRGDDVGLVCENITYLLLIKIIEQLGGMSLEYKHANEILISKGKNVLWLGDCTAAEDVEWIRHNNIRMVITAAAGLDIKYDASIRHYKYSLQDIKTENMIRYFDEIVQKIDKGLKWGSVLVHCGAGVSRSATLVIAYLIKYHKMSFLEALKFTKSRRPQICPNLGFELQLKKYAAPKILNTINSISVNHSPLSTSENFYNQSEWGMKTFLNHKMDSNQSFPQISRLIPKERDSEMAKGQTQPKGWRIAYNLKPQFASSSLDPKKQTQSYIKNIAKFRFGMTNASKWGIY